MQPLEPPWMQPSHVRQQVITSLSVRAVVVRLEGVAMAAGAARSAGGMRPAYALYVLACGGREQPALVRLAVVAAGQTSQRQATGSSWRLAGEAQGRALVRPPDHLGQEVRVPKSAERLVAR